MSSLHNEEHIRLKQQIADIYVRLGEAPPPPAPTPAPTPTPAPAPAGDTFNFTAGLPAGCTVTRSSIGYGRTPTVLTEYAANTARFDTISSVQGICWERTSQTYLAYGMQPGNTGWSTLGSGVTLTPNYGSINAPDGTSSSTRVQVATANGSGTRKATTPGGSGDLWASLWVRSATASSNDIFYRTPDGNAFEYDTAPTGAWKRIAQGGSIGANFNFDAGGNQTSADFLVYAASLQRSNHDPSDFPSTDATTPTRDRDRLVFTGLTNGSRDVQIDFLDGDAVTELISGITVAGATYTLDADSYTYAKHVVSEIRFIAAGSAPAPTPAPTPTPTPAPTPSPPAASTIFSSHMLSMNEAIPLVTTTFWPGFKRCGGYVNDEYSGGGTTIYPWIEAAPVTDGGGSNTSYAAAPNSVLRFGYFRVYRDRNDGNGWALIFEANKLGDFYHWDYYDKRGYDMNGYPPMVRNLASARNGGYAVPLDVFRHATHPVLHQYPSFSGPAFNGTDRISIQLQVRKELINTSGTDDRANIPVLIHVAADWNNGRGEQMHGSFKLVPDSGDMLITCTNITVDKTCASCAADGGSCTNYPGQFTSTQLDAAPPPTPAFFPAG